MNWVYRRLIPLFFSLFLVAGVVLPAKAQLYFPEDMVKVSARVIEKGSGEGVPYANVINQRIR